MASKGIALYLEGAKLQLASITVPVRTQGSTAACGPLAGDEPPLDLLPPPLPASFAALAAALAAVRGATTDALPFVAHIAGADSLCIRCQKAKVGDVFRLLRAKQAALGILVKDVKSHVNLLPPVGGELAAACIAAVTAALAARDWWRLDEHCLLGASPLEPQPDRQLVTAGMVQMHVHVAKDQRGALTLQLQVLPGGCWRSTGWHLAGCCFNGLPACLQKSSGHLCTHDHSTHAGHSALPLAVSLVQNRWSGGTLPAGQVSLWRSVLNAWQVGTQLQVANAGLPCHGPQAKCKLELAGQAPPAVDQSFTQPCRHAMHAAARPAACAHPAAAPG